jgi:hypothetical protein
MLSRNNHVATGYKHWIKTIVSQLSSDCCVYPVIMAVYSSFVQSYTWMLSMIFLQFTFFVVVVVVDVVNLLIPEIFYSPTNPY